MCIWWYAESRILLETFNTPEFYFVLSLHASARTTVLYQIGHGIILIIVLLLFVCEVQIRN